MCMFVKDSKRLQQYKQSHHDCLNLSVEKEKIAQACSILPYHDIHVHVNCLQNIHVLHVHTYLQFLVSGVLYVDSLVSVGHIHTIGYTCKSYTY